MILWAVNNILTNWEERFRGGEEIVGNWRYEEDKNGHNHQRQEEFNFHDEYDDRAQGLYLSFPVVFRDKFCSGMNEAHADNPRKGAGEP